jgi:two-component system, response regulator PdtaR
MSTRPGHRILVVEDNAFAALDMGEILTDRGFRVVGMVTTALDAIEKAAIEKAGAGVDLALVDVMLGGQSSGIGTAAVLKERYGVPSLFITAALPGMEARAAGLGYLSKPFTDEDLLRSIEAVMARLDGREPVNPPANLTLFI